MVSRQAKALLLVGANWTPKMTLEEKADASAALKARYYRVPFRRPPERIRGRNDRLDKVPARAIVTRASLLYARGVHDGDRGGRELAFGGAERSGPVASGTGAGEGRCRAAGGGGSPGCRAVGGGRGGRCA